VLNLLRLSIKLGKLMKEIRFGDHTLHFEHEEGTEVQGKQVLIPCITVLVFCEKCDSERFHFNTRQNIQDAPSQEIAFLGIFNQALQNFIHDIPASCYEARNLQTVKEVLEE